MHELGVPFQSTPPPRVSRAMHAGSDDAAASDAWPLLHAPLDVCLRCIGPSTCDALVQSFLVIGNQELVRHIRPHSVAAAVLHYHHHHHHYQHQHQHQQRLRPHLFIIVTCSAGDTLSLLYTDTNALDTAFLRSLSTKDVGQAGFVPFTLSVSFFSPLRCF